MDDITEAIQVKLDAFETAHGRLPIGDELMQLRMEVITEHAKAVGMPEPDGFVIVRVAPRPPDEDEAELDGVDWIEA